MKRGLFVNKETIQGVTRYEKYSSSYFTKASMSLSVKIIGNPKKHKNKPLIRKTSP